MNTSGVAVFAKNPALGRVKTRLAKTVGEQNALEVYLFLLKNILDEAKKTEADRYIFYDKDPVSPFFKQYKNRFNLIVQNGEDLGSRMVNCFEKLFSVHQKVVIVGSDIPYLNKEIIQSAFDGINAHQVAVGPTIDGGYYLIGFTKKAFSPDFFYQIKWGTSEVFEKTINKIKKVWYNPLILPMLQDIDTEEDLKILKEGL